MWIGNQTRPDTSNVVRAVARFAHAPTQKHWKAARRIFEYLNTSSSYGVAFQKGSGVELAVYADAAYAPKETKLKSILYPVQPWYVGVRPLNGFLGRRSEPHSPRLRRSMLQWPKISKRHISCGLCGVFSFPVLGTRFRGPLHPGFWGQKQCDSDGG